MSGPTDALTAVAAAISALGVTAIIKEFSPATPPIVEHVVLTLQAGALTREDSAAFVGDLMVSIDWFHPGAAADGQAEFLAAMDAFDAIVVALTTSLDRTCIAVDPGGNIQRNEESADLAHWYAGTIVVTFLRREVGA